MIAALRTKLARLIDPEYEKLQSFADVAILTMKSLEADIRVMDNEAQRHVDQLAELGKYKANYRLLAEAIRQRQLVRLVTTHNTDTWFPGTCTIDLLYKAFTMGAEFPHKELK